MNLFEGNEQKKSPLTMPNEPVTSWGPTIPESTAARPSINDDPPFQSVSKQTEKQKMDILGGAAESDSNYYYEKEGPMGSVIHTKDDPVNHPYHYTSGKIECIDFIDDCGYGLDFCIGNAIKYLTRCKKKGTCEQDLRKAAWYAQRAADGIQKGIYKI